jgi:5-methyltetrahydropteroyltriglutamate--homocysteine methyltransferase
MPTQKIATSVAGFPRIGERRELKKILEDYWSGKVSFDDVIRTGRELRKRHWLLQKNAGIGYISCNDFSYYDQMLDTAVMLGAVPERFSGITDPVSRYFAMARGADNAPAMEMTKWFNTNYHYIVPELSAQTAFSLDASKIVGEYREAKELGITPKVNIIGPVTFLLLSKRTDGGTPLDLLPKILPLYIRLFKELSSLDAGVTVQCDETALVKDPDDGVLSLATSAYTELCGCAADLKVILFTCFDHAREAVRTMKDVPLYGIGLDFVYGKENEEALGELNGKRLFAGIVDGRNIWKNNYRKSLSLLERIEKSVPREHLVIGTSSSLLHVPYSLSSESDLDPEIKSWMSFAEEKLSELKDLSEIFSSGVMSSGSSKVLSDNDRTFDQRSSSTKTNDSAVRKALSEVTMLERERSFDERINIQKKALNLPFLPTTTIGSFPQTQALRKLRADFKKRIISEQDYDDGIKAYIRDCVKAQEDIGLDVLVHGEPERNDMVEYFGEQLAGFAFTSNGWVQSYGSRCVKPPVIFGDVSRPRPMTVETIAYAQSLTKKPMKGMLTGPVTILNWSFVRDDLPRSAVCEQISLCIRDEINDLQNAGIRIVQVDEAAFREGYPLRKDKVSAYETWSVDCFRLAASFAHPETQIHTHMCYSDFNGIMHTIERMDADVITIETSRSGNKLLSVFAEHGYANEIGPGVYDIHSPRIPSELELETKIRELLRVLPPSKLWVNPDCGLKTRTWEEVTPSLTNMVHAVQNVRNSL